MPGSNTVQNSIGAGDIYSNGTVRSDKISSYTSGLPISSNSLIITPIPAMSLELANTATTTLTANYIYNGIVTVSTAGGAVNLQIDTAANIVSAMKVQNPNIIGNQIVKCLVCAYGSNANAITLTTNTGITLLGAPIIPGNTSRLVYISLSNVTAGSEAVAIF